MRNLRIVCPTCKTEQQLSESAINSGLHCTRCHAFFPVTSGFLDLLPEDTHRRNIPQRLMEWKPLINMYESRWWRKSDFFVFFTGISFQQEYDVILQAALLNGHESLLDIACGPGIYTRPLARRLEHGFVVGFDLSVPMLSYASSRAQSSGLENVLFIHGNAVELPFSDNEFECVNCCGALHIFPDIPRALSEIHRVLKPGGRFTMAAFRNWLPGQFSKKFADWYARHVGVNYFRPEDLEAYFKQIGFTGTICHHAKRYWLVMSAMKPA